MNYKIEALEKILDRKYQTIKVYLDRSDFSHIQIVRNKKGKFFTNVSKGDIKALRAMFAKRQSNKYPWRGEDDRT